MSSTINDLQDLHHAYTRLSDKFKSLWTFHQFLLGIHKSLLGDAPGYSVDFQAVYDQIRNVTTAMSSVAPAQVLDTIQRLDLQLDAVQQKLAEDDAKISPRHVRRFFEKVRTEDEKLILSILRFYFTLRHLDEVALDKFDFLITLVGARKSLDDGRSLARFPQELQKLFGSFLALTKRPPVPEAVVKGHVASLSSIRRSIEECGKFEELMSRQLLEGLRDAKRKLGPALFSIEVLSAVLETNLVAKNKYHDLYEAEERRILESSRQLLEAESNPRFGSGELQEEFRRFRETRESFDRRQAEEGVRHQDVRVLAESIGQLMARLEMPEVDTASGGAASPPLVLLPEAESADEPVLGGRAAHASVQRDPLTIEESSKITHSVESIGDGTGSGKAAFSKVLAPLRLEPWEVRSVRRILDAEEAGTGPDGRDRLFMDAASLRLRIDEIAQALRGSSHDPEMKAETRAEIDRRLHDAGRCLVRSQELDRLFRQELEEVAGVEEPEKLNELHRSRFRLLRAFSGLWLLHNQRIRD